jgi:hypothetical protein
MGSQDSLYRSYGVFSAGEGAGSRAGGGLTRRTTPPIPPRFPAAVDRWADWAGFAQGRRRWPQQHSPR